jgi:hypothetical protein
MRRALLVGGAVTVSMAGTLSLLSCADILGIGNRQLEEGGTAEGGMEAASGGPVVIETELNEPVRLVVDSTGENLYWTVAGNENTNGGVYSYNIQSGKTVPLQEGLAVSTDLAIDATYLYWINAAQGQIVKCEIASGCKSTTLLEKNTPAQSLAIDSTNLYWLSTDGTLHKADKIDGSKPTSLATTDDGLGAPDSCFIDPLSGDLLLSDPGGSTGINTVWRISNKGSGLTPLQTSAGCPCRFANSASRDYWTSYVNGKVVEIGTSGGPSSLLTAQNGPQRMTVDVATNELYLTNFGSGQPGNPDGTIVKFSANGKTVSNLAANLNPPIDIVVAGSYAYFMTWGVVSHVDAGEVFFKPNTGSIVRVPK